LTILVTGYTGFVGSTLVRALSSRTLRLVGRRELSGLPFDFFQKTLAEDCVYSDCLGGVEVIIHSAARAHVMNDNEVDALSAYRAINSLGTLNLAKQAAEAGVKRFIFISSIKVNGELTEPDKPYTYSDQPDPQDPYGISKAEAEKGLMDIAHQTKMEVVIIRPPLVYGSGVKANFASMMRLAAKNLPLPLGSIKNKRSLVAIDNLVDLIITCIDHPKAANQTFLISDDHDVSTTELLRELTIAAGKKPCLIPVPMKFIQMIATLLGKKTIADRLCGNLQVDISHTKDTLGWTPPISFKEGIARCFIKDK
tara:strand:- start:1600 stop:2529 length:930 start_codon:yes stop_codon:yes gene_type:complete